MEVSSPPEATMGHRPARHGLLHIGCKPCRTRALTGGFGFGFRFGFGFGFGLGLGLGLGLGYPNSKPNLFCAASSKSCGSPG